MFGSGVNVLGTMVTPTNSESESMLQNIALLKNQSLHFSNVDFSSITAILCSLCTTLHALVFMSMVLSFEPTMTLVIVICLSFSFQFQECSNCIP